MFPSLSSIWPPFQPRQLPYQPNYYYPSPVGHIRFHTPPKPIVKPVPLPTPSPSPLLAVNSSLSSSSPGGSSSRSGRLGRSGRSPLASETRATPHQPSLSPSNSSVPTSFSPNESSGRSGRSSHALEKRPAFDHLSSSPFSSSVSTSYSPSGSSGKSRGSSSVSDSQSTSNSSASTSFSVVSGPSGTSGRPSFAPETRTTPASYQPISGPSNPSASTSSASAGPSGTPGSSSFVLETRPIPTHNQPTPGPSNSSSSTSFSQSGPPGISGSTSFVPHPTRPIPVRRQPTPGPSKSSAPTSFSQSGTSESSGKSSPVLYSTPARHKPTLAASNSSASASLSKSVSSGSSGKASPVLYSTPARFQPNPGPSNSSASTSYSQSGSLAGPSTSSRQRTTSLVQALKKPLKGILKKPGQSSNPSTSAARSIQKQPRASGSNRTLEDDLSDEDSIVSSTLASRTQLQLEDRTPTPPSSSSLAISRIENRLEDRTPTPIPEIQALRTQEARRRRTRSQENHASSNGPIAGSSARPPSPRYRERATIIRVPMKEEAIALNWPLVNPAPSMKPKSNAIQWDIADDPRQYGTVKLWYRSAFVGYAATEMLVVPASTHVRLTEMRILLDQQDFKCWPIDIKRENGITCLDVLVAIYLTLQRPLMGEEVQNALHWRPGIMKRVNLLSARRLFHGLIQDGDTWTALLCRVPDPNDIASRQLTYYGPASNFQEKFC